jgi:hypothetical protein
MADPRGAARQDKRVKEEDQTPRRQDAPVDRCLAANWRIGGLAFSPLRIHPIALRGKVWPLA